MTRELIGWRVFLSPRWLLFLTALLNYLWFFSASGFVERLGASGTKISFCVVCPWYWEWSLTNLPSLSLLAAACLLMGNLKGYVPSLLIAGYEVIEGTLWLSRLSFAGGVSQRLEVYSESDIYDFWTLLDVQYFFATMILMTSVVYVIKEILRPDSQIP